MNIYIIGDTQLKPGIRDPLIQIAKHICEVKPDYIIHLGDHYDLPSLSNYDKGKKFHRTKTLKKDIEAGDASFEKFFSILNKRWKSHKKCKKIILQGNHEDRRRKHLEFAPDEYIDIIEECDFNYSGWDRVVPFLKEITVKGITFCHFFQQDKSASAISSARAILSKRHASCIAGHAQGFEYHEALAANGKTIQSIILGSSYYHKESYKNHTNHHFRGTVLLKDVRGGQFDFERFSMKRLDKIK